MDAVRTLAEELGEFVEEFRGNPFRFLYEAEIQAALFMRLAAAFGEWPVSLVGGAHDADHYGVQHDGVPRRIQTLPVHMEYPAVTRFDLAILVGDGVGRGVEAPRAGPICNDSFWTQPVRFAVELKYCQLGDRPTSRYRQLLADLEKMERYGSSLGSAQAFGGLGLLFVQSHSEYLLRDVRHHLHTADGVTALPNGVRGYVIAPYAVYGLSGTGTGSGDQS